MMRGYCISVSFSCPGEMYSQICTYRKEKRFNMSQAIARLVRLGFTYSLMLEEQVEQKRLESVKSAKKKKAKPKTRSKTK